MKKSLVFLLCFVAVAANAAIQLEEHPIPLALNGKSIGNGYMLNGNLVMPVDDFSKAAGLRLGQGLQLMGNRLMAGPPGAIILQNNAFHVRKAGEISSHVTMVNGRGYVPVADIAKAFGVINWVAPVGLKAGQPVSLNFTVNGDGVLAFGH